MLGKCHSFVFMRLQLHTTRLKYEVSDAILFGGGGGGGGEGRAKMGKLTDFVGCLEQVTPLKIDGLLTLQIIVNI